MAYHFNIPVGNTGNIFSATIDTDTFYCDGVTYRSTPRFNFDQRHIQIGNYQYGECKADGITLNGLSQNGYRAAISIEDILNTGYVHCYTNPDLSSNFSQFSGGYGQSNTSWGDITFTSFSNTGAIPYSTYTFKSQWVTGMNTFTISTNVPVFETNAEASQYINDGTGLQSAVNYRETTMLRFPVTTGAGGSGTVIIDIGKYSCNGTDYLSNPKAYFRYKAHSYYGWFMVSNIDIVNSSGGQSTWSYRVGYSMQTALNQGAFRGNNDPSYMGMGLYTQNKEGQAQGSYASVTPTTYNNQQQHPSQVLGWRDFRVDRLDECIFSTNAPIFMTDDELRTYIRYGTGIENAINYYPTYPEETGDKWTSAKLNLLRRRLMRLAVGEMDYTPYFNYTIADGKAWVTSVKRDRWYQDFGNLNITIPNSLEGYPVVVVNEVWE